MCLNKIEQCYCILGENVKLFILYFNTAFHYVSGEPYHQHKIYSGYSRERQTELLNQGIDINIVDQRKIYPIYIQGDYCERY